VVDVEDRRIKVGEALVRIHIEKNLTRPPAVQFTDERNIIRQDFFEKSGNSK